MKPKSTTPEVNSSQNIPEESDCRINAGKTRECRVEEGGGGGVGVGDKYNTFK